MLTGALPMLCPSCKIAEVKDIGQAGHTVPTLMSG